jgi:hypothetical protein
MSLLSDNVIPSDHGKVFGTNAESDADLDKIKKAILRVEGVKDVMIDEHTFPREFTIHTNKIVEVKAIEDAVISVGFHITPKHMFGL